MKYLGPGGACERLGVSYSGLRYFEYTGQLKPVFTADRKRLYAEVDIEALRLKREREQESREPAAAR